MSQKNESSGMGKKPEGMPCNGTKLEGMPYVFKRIPTTILTSKQGYQRPLNQRRVDYIAAHFDKNLFDPILVSWRDNTFFVVDGQHRIAALKQRNGGKDVIVPCNVLVGLTYQQEADTFEKVDACKTRLSVSDYASYCTFAGWLWRISGRFL